MSEEKKYPKVGVGIFIFNDKGELFLARGVKWHNKYTCPGGKVEMNESVIETVKREAKEETNMDIEDISLVAVTDGLNLDVEYTKEDNHFVFLNYKAKAKNTKKIKLNEEATEYKWLTPNEWLERKDVGRTAAEVIKNNLVDDKDDFEGLYKRALADYQNLAKQSAEEKASLVKHANAQLILEMIPVYDNLKTAINFSDESVAGNGWAEGIKYVIKQFKEVLENNGVKEIETVGQKFDHNKMEAAESEETDDKKKDDTVARELKSGYEMHGKIINAARVVVYKYNKNS